MPAEFALAARRRPRLGRWLGATLVLVTAVTVAAAAAGVIGHRAVAAVVGADARWLMLAALWTVIGYAVAGQAVRGAAPGALTPTEAILLPYAGAAANRVLPAGTGAVAVTTRVLSTRGVDVSAALGLATAAAIGTGLAGVALLAIALACLGAGALSLPGLHPALPHPSGVALPVAAGSIAAAIATAALITARRGNAGLVRHNNIVTRIFGRLVEQRPSGRTVTRFLIFALLSRVTQLGVLLAATAAVGHEIDIGPALVVLGAAGLAGGLIPIAGGAGGVEATLALALHTAGLPVPAAVAAALLSRLIGYWIPALIGIPALAMLTARDTVARHAPANRSPAHRNSQRVPLTGAGIATALTLLATAGAAAWD